MAKYDSFTEDLLTEIVGHCYEISTQTKADAFFEYAPHTSEITIEYIRYKGTNSIYFNDEDGTERLEYALEQLAKLHDQYEREMNLSEEVEI